METVFQKSMRGKNLNVCWPALLFDSIEDVQKYMDENEEDCIDREDAPNINAMGVYGYQQGVTLVVRQRRDLEFFPDPDQEPVQGFFED
jgi:hypothetical protein